jgi:hypothetical protein
MAVLFVSVWVPQVLRGCGGHLFEKSAHRSGFVSYGCGFSLLPQLGFQLHCGYSLVERYFLIVRQLSSRLKYAIHLSPVPLV